MKKVIITLAALVFGFTSFAQGWETYTVADKDTLTKAGIKEMRVRFSGDVDLKIASNAKTITLSKNGNIIEKTSSVSKGIYIPSGRKGRIDASSGWIYKMDTTVRKIGSKIDTMIARSKTDSTYVIRVRAGKKAQYLLPFVSAGKATGADSKGNLFALATAKFPTMVIDGKTYNLSGTAYLEFKKTNKNKNRHRHTVAGNLSFHK